MMSAIIEARDLVKRFDGFTAVDHISFAVPEGVIFGFLGPNGAGKTTTIKMLTTVLSPTEGQLRIAGHDPVKEPLLVRRAFGIVFQDPSLDGELTAAETWNCTASSTACRGQSAASGSRRSYASLAYGNGATTTSSASRAA